jgi:molybdopterin converting factor small subunit
MRITFKLFANLRDYLPAGTHGLGVQIEVEEGMTPNKIIDQWHIPRELAHVVLLNGVYLEPEVRDIPSLKEGDVLSIWPPVAGG